MTIHQSKGLEFKIVFLLGANKAAPDSKRGFKFSTTEIQLPETGQTRTQRVVAIADKNFLQQNELDQHQQRAQAEQNRLWYVALTRASHRVYAVFEPERVIRTNCQDWHSGRIRVKHSSIHIVWMKHWFWNDHRLCTATTDPTNNSTFCTAFTYAAFLCTGKTSFQLSGTAFKTQGQVMRIVWPILSRTLIRRRMRYMFG